MTVAIRHRPLGRFLSPPAPPLILNLGVTQSFFEGISYARDLVAFVSNFTEKSDVIAKFRDIVSDVETQNLYFFTFLNDSKYDFRLK